MFTQFTTVVAVVTCIFLTLVLLFLLRRRWTPSKLREANDATVFYITVSGTIYAVIVAFMLTNVWEAFAEVRINAESEANALVSVSRLAGGIPDPLRARIQELTRTYAGVMVSEEWPAMGRGGVSERGTECVEQMWQTVMQIQPATPSEQVVYNRLLSELTQMTEHRNVRLIQSRNKVPGVLWAVLILGGVITVGISCLLGVESPRLHAMYIVALTCLVSLTLVAIAEIDHPFEGQVSVPPESFELAITALGSPVRK